MLRKGRMIGLNQTKPAITRTIIQTRAPVKPVHSIISYIDPVQASYFTGKGIILFTMFYCTANWWMYRRYREDCEDTENIEQNDDDTTP
jgi:cbb3-type cytochrome oxidase subunit 3